MKTTFVMRDDLYKQIGLEDYASIEKVRAEYKRRALLVHPDRGGDPEQMKALNLIYESLTKYKAEYDAWLRRQKAPAAAAAVFNWEQAMASAMANANNRAQWQWQYDGQTVWRYQ